MRIGLTYDLREDYLNEGYSSEETAEFDKISTIEQIEESLQFLGYETHRIGNIKNLVNELRYNRLDMVFNICEGMYGSGRESQVPSLLDAYKIPYTFSDPLVLSLTLNKGMTKRVIRDAGIKTASFIIVNNEDDILKFFTYNNLKYPLFVKPNSEGSGKWISEKSKVNNANELWHFCKNIWTEQEYELIIEEYLPGREFTVGIIGSGNYSSVLGCMEINFNDVDKIYSYEVKENYEKIITYTVPDDNIKKEVCDLALKTWKLLGCRDAGRIDIRLDDNNIPNIIEVNPLAGLNKTTSDLPILAKLNGFDYNYIIENIMESAKKRILK